MATKGNSFRGLDMQQLEGGIGGGMGGAGGSGFGGLASKAVTGALAVGAGAGVKKLNDQQNKYDEAREKATSNEKTPTERAKEDAKEMKLQERTNKAAEAASKNMAKGGKVSSASRRADGIATKGKTRGRLL